MTVIGKCGIGPAKNIVLQSNAIENVDAIFKNDMVADDRAFFDKTTIANITMLADLSIVLNIDECPQTGVVGASMRFALN